MFERIAEFIYDLKQAFGELFSRIAQRKRFFIYLFLIIIGVFIISYFYNFSRTNQKTSLQDQINELKEEISQVKQELAELRTSSAPTPKEEQPTGEVKGGIIIREKMSTTSSGKNGLTLNIKGIEIENENTRVNLIFRNSTKDPQIIPAQDPTPAMTELSSIESTKVTVNGIHYGIIEGSFPLVIGNAKVILYKNGYTYNTTNIVVNPGESYEGYLVFPVKLEGRFTFSYPLFKPITYKT